MLKEHPVLEKFSMDSKSYVVLKYIGILVLSSARNGLMKDFFNRYRIRKNRCLQLTN